MRAVLADLPDCLLLDYLLPDLDAPEVLAALAGPDGLTVCPVVVVTGAARPDAGRAVLRAGAQDYIGKDWLSPQGLARAVENAIERWAMACELRARTGRDAFRLSLAAALRPLADPAAAQAAAAAVLCGHLRASRVSYLPARPGGELAAGRDAAAAVGADLSVPVLKDGELVAVLVVHQSTPRQWTADEVALAEETAEATWAAVLRGRAEEALRASEERLRLAARVAGLAVAEVDYATDQIRLSPEAAALLGLPTEPATVPRAAVHALFHPDDRAVIAGLIAASQDPDGPGEFELDHRIIRPDGQIRWHGVRKQVVFADRRPVRALLTLFDITARKEAAAQLQRNHDTFYALIQNNPFGVYIVDADFRLRQVSQGAQKVFDAVRPLLNRDFGEVMRALWPEPVATEVLGRFQHTLTTGDPYNEPRMVQRRADIDDVEAYDWRIERTTLPDGRFGVVCYFYDLTERQRWEAALRAKEQDLRSLTDNSPVILTRFDRDLRYVFVNAAVERATGRTPAEVIGKTNRELETPADLCDPWDAAILHVFERGEPTSLEFAFESLDGPRHYTARLVPEFGGDGAVEFVLGVSHDITERRRAEQLLAERDVRKDEFLATLAHELRNPLAPIRSGVAVLRLNRAPEEAEEVLGMIDRQIGHLVHLVDDLLDVSRLRNGTIALRAERVALRDAVDGAVEACRPTLDAKGHTLEATFAGGPWIVDGDMTRLVQVVANLLTNAAKYSHPGGRIVVAVEGDGGEAIVRVVDHGVGISREALPTVWNMFSQVRDTLDKAQGGLGIGLSLVRKLVELHGGSVTAESAGVGRGSTFTVRLPLAAAETAAAPPAKSASAPARTSPLRVLVVDDNVDAAEMLMMFLELSGHVTQGAHTGPDALAAARAFAPNVAFLDIGLPGMDGYEVARRLRADPVTADIVLAALTGWGREDDKRRSREVGFDFHLTKPVDQDAIRDVLAQSSAFGRRRGSQGATASVDG